MSESETGRDVERRGYDSQALLDEAMQLHKRHYERSGAALTSRIKEWRQRSPAHEQAWQQASAYWSAAGHVTRPERETRREQWALQAEILLERLRGYQPLRVAVPLMTTAAVIMALVWLYPQTVGDPTLQPDSTRPETAAFAAEYRTAWQEQRSIDLPDGSTIGLNWASQVSVDYGDDRRVVTLDSGEAIVNVKPDPDRPFRVQSGSTQAVAVGTRFSVYRQDEDQVSVTVQEGTVRVSDDREPQPVTLTANQQVRLRQGMPGDILTIDADARMAWQDGLVVFRQRPLEEALQELARYAGIRTDIESLPPAAPPVSGTYLTTRAADGFRLIAEAYDLRLDQQGAELRIQYRPSPVSR